MSALVGERHGLGPSDEGEITLEALERNPYPIYRRLRDEGVVWVEAAGRWLVTRWDDVDAVERDSEAFTAMEEASLQTRVMGRTSNARPKFQRREWATFAAVTISPMPQTGSRTTTALPVHSASVAQRPLPKTMS